MDNERHCTSWPFEISSFSWKHVHIHLNSDDQPHLHPASHSLRHRIFENYQWHTQSCSLGEWFIALTFFWLTQNFNRFSVSSILSRSMCRRRTAVQPHSSTPPSASVGGSRWWCWFCICFMSPRSSTRYPGCRSRSESSASSACSTSSHPWWSF